MLLIAGLILRHHSKIGYPWFAAQRSLEFAPGATAAADKSAISRADAESELQAKEINGGKTMSFGIYILGYIILIIGLAIGANMLHLPPKWIGVGILCLVGVAIMHGVTTTRQRDPSS